MTISENNILYINDPSENNLFYNFLLQSTFNVFTISCHNIVLKVIRENKIKTIITNLPISKINKIDINIINEINQIYPDIDWIAFSEPSINLDCVIRKITILNPSNYTNFIDIIENAIKTFDLKEKNKTLLFEIEKSNKNEEKALLLKNCFLSNISHEIRTPLNAIMGFSTIICNQTENDLYANLIQDATMQLVSTIDNLLIISKIQSDNEKIEFSEVNLFQFTSMIIDKYKIKTIQAGLKFRTNIVNKDIYIYTDMGKLFEIICKLLDNAIKFTKKGTVGFVVNIDSHNLNIEISDSGIGINKNQLDDIYDPFWQAEQTKNRKFEGLGLGLAIVKNYVSFLSGNISVKSEIGIGTTFNISIPLSMGLSGNN